MKGIRTCGVLGALLASAAVACEERSYCDQPLSCDPADAGGPEASASGTFASEDPNSSATIRTTDGGAMSDGTLEVRQDDRADPIDEPSSSDSGASKAPVTTGSDGSGAGAQSSTRDASDGLPEPPTLPDAASAQANTAHSTGGALDSDASPQVSSSNPTEDASSPTTVSEPTWRSPSRLTTGVGGVVGARLALTTEGRGLVVWQPTDKDGAWLSSLLARTYDPVTGDWSDTVDVVSGELNLQYRIFADGQDSFVLVWQNLEPLEVRSKRYDGANWSESSTVVPGKALFDLAATSDGAVVGWPEYSEDDELYFVMARSWNPAFHAWNSREIVQTSASQVSDVAVAHGPDGATFALWLELPVADDVEVWANHSTEGGDAWDTSEQVGTSTQRERGSNLVVTEDGDLLVRWSGRFEGKLWNNASKAWGTLEMLGPYRDATMCGIGEDDALLLGREAGSHLWSQFWNGSVLEPETALTDVDSQAPLLACNKTTGVATWSNEVRRWINETNEWDTAHHFDDGTPLDIAISDTGEAMMARGVGSNGGTFSELEVEHFE